MLKIYNETLAATDILNEYILTSNYTLYILNDFNQSSSDGLLYLN